MTTHACETCSVTAELERMGMSLDRFDRVVALAGNPNTGKSTLFNALTGLRQHTGNWPGKTVTRAEGGFEFNKIRYKLVDLPGTYSLLSASSDEEIARDFLLFGRPDATIVVTAVQVARRRSSSTKARRARIVAKSMSPTREVVSLTSHVHHTPHVGRAQIMPVTKSRTLSATPTSIAPVVRLSQCLSPRHR